MKMFEFDKNDAFRFAQEQMIETRQRGDELIFKICPYCKRREPNNQKTFSINLQTGQFKCLRSSCGAQGNMITLARDFNFELSSTDANEYYRLGQHRRRFRKLKNMHPEPKDFAVEYMRSRGIPEEITKKYNITVRNDRPEVLTFPFYDETNTLQFIKYRNTDPEAIEKYGKEYSEKNCRPILFGMNHCDPEQGTLVLTEGQIDSLSCAAAGVPNAVSVPTGANGFTWVPYCWDFLKRFKTLIVFGDHEKDHITLLEEMTKRFRGVIRHIREEDYQGCKDANELLQKAGPEAVAAAVANAVLVRVADIIDLADVKVSAPELKEQIPTGFNKLNRIIGGFFGGQLAILTGLRGLGKSTLASQMVINAVINGWNSFYYSGELSNSNVREWLELQIAGRERTTSYSINGKEFHKILPEYSEAAADWYRGKVYTKDEVDYSNEDGDVVERSLPDIVEDAINKYDCRFIVIDNLMTAITDNLDTDKYREQSVFLKGLTKLAQKYNVFVLLVAHPRKLSGGRITNDDVSGSGDITNLASIVLEYGRPKEDENESPEVNAKRRVMKVLKNRLTGDIDENGFELFYDSASKRISEYEDQFLLDVNLVMPGGFMNEPDDFIPVQEEMEDLPF